MKGQTADAAERVFPPYEPPSSRSSRVSASVAIAVVGLLLTFATGFVVVGRRDQIIDNKVDKAELEQFKTTLEQRLGSMQGDIRVIRLCVEKPGACSQSAP